MFHYSINCLHLLLPQKNKYYTANTLSGYVDENRFVNFNEYATSSTTKNMTGVFDMNGGALEFVSAYAKLEPESAWSDELSNADYTNIKVDVSKFTRPEDVDVLTFTSPSNILTDINKMDGWLFNELVTELDTSSPFEMETKIWDLPVYIYGPYEIVLRGKAANDTESTGGTMDNGLLANYIVPYEILGDGLPYPIGFRPSILMAGDTQSSGDIEVSNITVDVKGKETNYAGVGDTVVITLELNKGSMYIDNVKINGDKSPNRYNGLTELNSSFTAKKWVLEYDVVPGDNGLVTFSYNFVLIEDKIT